MAANQIRVTPKMRQVMWDVRDAARDANDQAMADMAWQMISATTVDQRDWWAVQDFAAAMDVDAPVDD